MKMRAIPTSSPPIGSQTEGRKVGANESNEVLKNAVAKDASGKGDDTPMLNAAAGNGGLLTAGGSWNAEHFSGVSTKTQRGADIKLAFAPAVGTDANEIALMQTVRVHKRTGGDVDENAKWEAQFGGSAPRESRSVKAKDGRSAATNIDRSDGYSSPFFGEDDQDVVDAQNKRADEKKSRTNFKLSEPRCQSGFSAVNGVEGRDAWLHDVCKQKWAQGQEIEAYFEVAAIAKSGKDSGLVYGTVEWGFTVDSAGNVTLQGPKVLNIGNASETFHDAMDAWNTADPYTSNVATTLLHKDNYVRERVPIVTKNDQWELPERGVGVPDFANMENAKEAKSQLDKVIAAQEAIKTKNPDAYNEDLAWRQLEMERKQLAGG
jgi:hypothetical protein